MRHIMKYLHVPYLCHLGTITPLNVDLFTPMIFHIIAK